MRVLVVTPEFHQGGGIGTFYRQLVPQLRSMGCEVDVLINAPFDTDESSQHADVIGPSQGALDEQRKNFLGSDHFHPLGQFLRTSFAAFETVDPADYDVIEAADWGLGFVPFVLNAQTPVVVRAHASAGQVEAHEDLGSVTELSRQLITLESLGMRAASAVTSYSQANCRYWENLLCREVPLIPPALVRASAENPLVAADTSYGLVAGRVQRWKGAEVLCEAFAGDTPTEARIEWYGSSVGYDLQGRAQNYCDYLAAKFPQVVGKNVLFKGPTTQDHLDELRQTAGFCLVPSTWDVFNFTAAEALAAGRPLIVSEQTGISGYLDNGQHALIYDGASPSELSATLKKFLGMSADQVASIARAGQERARSLFSPESVGKATLALYEDVKRTHKPLGTEHDFARSLIREWLQFDPRAQDRALSKTPIKGISRHLAKRIIGRVFPR